jgi:phosphohistidine swiveling domain-containing protein
MGSIGDGDRSRVGAKAWALARLHRSGVSVPSGVVIPVEGLQEFLESNGWSERARSGGDPSLQRDIRAANLSTDLRTAVQAAVAQYGEQLVVRSSGVDEDGPVDSFAGQLDSVLGVAPGAQLEAAILRCWASAWGERAQAYRARRGHAGPLSMAVLIQPVVHPRCAGVMFTVNPHTGSWREMSVEAAWGQCEAVVSGEVVPDGYVVRRPRRSPRPVQRILARVRLEVMVDQVRSQATMRRAGVASPVPVPAGLVDAPKLRHQELLKLCRLGLRLEGLMGAPQDVEWAMESSGRFVVLQSRPVTTQVNVRRSGPPVWTRRFVGERWTEPATPLGWSLMQEPIDRLIGYPKTQRELLDGGVPSRLVRFAPYFNVTMFRYLAFKLPGAAPPRFMMELLPPAEERSWVRRRAQAPDLRVYQSVLRESIAERRWRRFGWNPLTNPRSWRALEEELCSTLPVLGAPIETLRGAAEVHNSCRALTRRYIGIHICSLLYANMSFQLCEAALEARGLRHLAPDALRPVAQSWTVRTNQALWALGRGEMPISVFLERFGHRAASSWELFSPRWAEAPERVELLADAAAQHADPARMAAEQAERAQLAREQLPAGLRQLISLTQDYLLLREDQRFRFDQLLWVWKRALLWMEADLGVPVRFLDVSELDSLLSGRLGKAEALVRVAAREPSWHAEVKRRATGDEPAVFLVGSEASEPPQVRQRLQGMGISRGTVTGRVRVLRSVDQAARLQPGEVLVARCTDPGWTPLFMKAGGLVMELGGMLSHGAVVAREYGLPAVVNVTDATRLLKDGDRVTLDGSSGVVWLR